MTNPVHDFDCDGAVLLGRALGKHSIMGLRDGSVLVLRNVPADTLASGGGATMVKCGVGVSVPYLKHPYPIYLGGIQPDNTFGWEHEDIERSRLCIPDLYVDVFCAYGPITRRWFVWSKP